MELLVRYRLQHAGIPERRMHAEQAPRRSLARDRPCCRTCRQQRVVAGILRGVSVLDDPGREVYRLTVTSADAVLRTIADQLPTCTFWCVPLFGCLGSGRG
jgi:hypothetical protein